MTLCMLHMTFALHSGCCTPSPTRHISPAGGPCNSTFHFFRFQNDGPQTSCIPIRARKLLTCSCAMSPLNGEIDRHPSLRTDTPQIAPSRILSHDSKRAVTAGQGHVACSTNDVHVAPWSAWPDRTKARPAAARSMRSISPSQHQGRNVSEMRRPSLEGLEHRTLP